MSQLSSKARERLLYLISPIGLLLLWQALLMLGLGDRRFIPAPSDIAVRFWTLTASGELALHVGVTLYRVLLGFLVGVVPAVAMGLLMAMFKPVRIFFDPLIASLFPIPKIALMPLLLLAFGFGDASKIALVAIAVFFPVIVNTYVGAANIDRIYWDVELQGEEFHVHRSRLARVASDHLPVVARVRVRPRARTVPYVTGDALPPAE